MPTPATARTLVGYVRRRESSTLAGSRQRPRWRLEIRGIPNGHALAQVFLAIVPSQLVLVCRLVTDGSLLANIRRIFRRPWGAKGRSAWLHLGARRSAGKKKNQHP